MFKNLKIGAKINATVMIVLALALVSSGTGIYFLNGVNNQLNNIVDVSAEKIKLADRINRNLVEIGRAEKNIILSESQAKMDSYATPVALYNQQVQDSLAKLAELTSSEQANARLDRFQSAYDEFLANNATVQELAYAGKSQQAVALSQNEGRAAFDQAAELMDQISEENEALLVEDKVSSDQAFLRSIYIQSGVVALALIVGLALGFAVSRGIARNLRAIVKSANQLADGDLTREVTAQSNDEVGELAVALEKAMMGINNMLQETNAMINQVVQSVDQVRSISQDLATNAEEQSSAMEEVTSNLEETDSQVRANTENANVTNQLVNETTNQASIGQKKMQAMTEAMDGIANSSREIARIIKVIDEIAFQTNLLALNAAVEAARAGQHGRGFAVVAQEVRNLAGRSAKAAKETADLIENAGRRVQEGVAISGETAASLSEIVDNVIKVKDLAAEIAAASDEQTRGLGQISSAMVQVNQGSQSSSQQSEELASTADELGNLADRLREQSARFQLRGNENAIKFAANIPAKTPAATGKAPVHPVAAPAGTVNGKKNNGKLELVLDNDERGYGNF